MATKPKPEWIELGEALKKTRNKAGLSQKRLAKLVGMGIGYTEIYRCEHGLIDLPPRVLMEICRVCKVSEKRLLYYRNQCKANILKSHMPPPKDTTTTIRVTKTERALIDSYRRATIDIKKAGMSVLNGTLDPDALKLVLRITKMDDVGGKTASQIVEGICD